jgi:hypothetical protein
MLDFMAKFPFYVKMFADAGFPLTSDQTSVADALVDSLVMSGNESTVAAGLDELNVALVPITDAGDEQSRLMHLIGQL